MPHPSPDHAVRTFCHSDRRGRAGSPVLGWLKPGGPPPAFEERAPHERGFAGRFERTVAPRLRRLELLRRVALAVFVVVLAVGLPVAAAVAWIALSDDARLLKLAIILLLGTVGLALVPIAFFMGREQRLLLPAIGAHVGGFAALIKPRATAAAVAPFRALGLVPPVKPRAAWRKPKETVSIDDLFIGRHRGVELWLAELDDVQKQGGRETRLFRGTLIAFALPAAARGYRPWRLRAPDRGDPSRLAIEPPPAADAPGGAIDLATPAVLDALGALTSVLAPASVAGAHDGTVLRVAMALKDRSRPFDVGNPFLPVYRCEPAVRAALAQLTAVRDVMDALADAAEPAR